MRKFHPEIKVLIDQLQEMYPVAFPKKPHPKVPLAHGCVKVIQKVLNINYHKASAILHWWCKGKRYNEACVEGASRYRIDGKPKGVVTKKQAEYAKAQQCNHTSL